ncbi:FAD-binding protein, partial [Aerosakkonemataceae cyanobacterium BLCC-F50]
CLITEKFELIPVHTLLDVGTGRLYGYNPYPVRLLWLAIAHFVRNAGNVNLLAQWGYPFPNDDENKPYRRSLQGPDYMRLMRKQVKKAGVKILDHSPALQLLVDKNKAIGGAIGINRQSGNQWIVRSPSVIIATGGCAFLSKALGCNVLTGDGYLMAAEAGAEMSGMEFSNAYGISPAFSSVTKTLFYRWATFTYEDGTPIPGAGSQHGRSVIAKTLLSQPVYASADENIVKAREAAAMVATARWMYNSAIARQETRGMHKHLDYPELDPNQQHYLVSGGLDRVWVKPEPVVKKAKVGVGV